MHDPRAVRREIETNVEPERAATDMSLRRERQEADSVMEESVDRELERAREATDEELAPPSRAEGELPAVADTLVEAADTLANAADGLAQAALRLKDIADTGAVSELHAAQDTLDDAVAKLSGRPPEPDTRDRPVEPGGAPEPLVADTLSAVAASLGAVAESLADERKESDGILRDERARLDETLQDERAAFDDALDAEREARRALLDRERALTDHQLARERDTTDRAVDEALALLQDEQSAHREARDVIFSRDEYLSIVTHDLRMPLSVISVCSTLLADHGREDARISELTSNIGRAASLMGRMLTDLLDLSRFEAGCFRLSPTVDDAVPVVRECVASFTPLARAENLSLTMETSAHRIPAAFDRDRLIQVVSNLLRNAIQYTPAGGTIVVTVQPEEHGCRIAVRDTGVGIPAGDLDRVFDRFFQVGRGAERRGLGLGLHICKAIVEAHGGRIWASSEPGSGSTFYFTLPG